MFNDTLRTALDSPDARRALSAARTLAKLSAEQVAPALTALAEELRSTPSRQRRAALVCGVLGRGALELAPQLRDLLVSPRWSVRESGLHALARIEDRDSLAAAGECALDRNAAVRAAALELLARHKDIPAAVTAALTHRHPRIRCRALCALARLDPLGHVTTIADALLHSHRRVRRTAATLLGELGANARNELPRLARCRCDGDNTVAEAARQALLKLSPHIPDALHPLFGSQTNYALLDDLLALAAPDVREQLEAIRQARRERLPGRDSRAKTRWLVGRLVELTVADSV